MALVQKVITAVRGICAPNATIPSVGALDGASSPSPTTTRRPSSRATRRIVAEQGRCGEVRVRRSGASFSGEFVLSKTAMAMAGDVEVMVPLEGLVDTKAERQGAKLEKDLAKLVQDRDYLERQARRSELRRAARRWRCVDKVRARLAEVEAGIAKIEVALKRLG